MRLTDNRLNCCIALTKHAFELNEARGHIYMYSSPENITIVESSRVPDYEFDNFADFMERMEPKEMVDLSVNLGIRFDFKTGSKQELALAMWSSMCLLADDRRNAKSIEKRNPITGNKKRGRKKQNLGSRRYTLLINEPDFGGDVRKALLNYGSEVMTTRQANKIWEFFVDEFLNTGSKVITEARMANIVNDRAEELRTKQDPWRIFQYYRPELIDCRLIKLEK